MLKKLIKDGPDTATVMFSYFQGVKDLMFQTQIPGEARENIYGHIVALEHTDDANVHKIKISVRDDRELHQYYVTALYNPIKQSGEIISTEK